jgi:hypothetical protein
MSDFEDRGIKGGKMDEQDLVSRRANEERRMADVMISDLGIGVLVFLFHYSHFSILHSFGILLFYSLLLTHHSSPYSDLTLFI